MDQIVIDNEEKFLQGKLKGYSLKGKENKFNEEGKPLYFPGCTIICKIFENSNLFNELNALQLMYKNLNLNEAYTYLPPSSFHMTLFDCCNINTINSSSWPTYIDPKKNYKEIALELNKKIKDFAYPDKFNLKLKKIFGGYCIALEGATEKDEKILRDCRNKLSELLDIKYKNHENYVFHITLAYILRDLSIEEIKQLIVFNKKKEEYFKKKIPIITIKNPVMCFFENMWEFMNI